MAPDFLGPSLLPQERPGLSPSFRPRCLLCHCCASLPLPSSFGWSFRLCSGCCASGPQRTGPCRPQPTWCAAPTAACICLRPRRSPATACTSAANSILNNTARVDRRATGRQTFRRRRPLRSVRSPVLAAPTASSVHPCRGRCKVSAYPIRNRALDERYRMLDFSHTAARPLGADDDTGRRQTWKPLALLNVYRLVLSGLLTFIALTHIELTPLGEYHPLLFVAISVAYFLMALLFTVTLRARVPNFTLQLHAQLLTDIVCIVLLTYASGGIRSGLGTLLVVSLAGGGMLLGGRMAVLYAAISTLALLGEESYIWVRSILREPNFTHAGVLGGTFFLTVLVAHALARRARESEALAAQRGVDLANMQQLAEYVLQRMQTGVIVIDPNQRIRLINEAAGQLRGFPTNPTRQTLNTLSPELAYHLDEWQQQPDGEPQLERPTAGGPE